MLTLFISKSFPVSQYSVNVPVSPKIYKIVPLEFVVIPKILEPTISNIELNDFYFLCDKIFGSLALGKDLERDCGFYSCP